MCTCTMGTYIYHMNDAMVCIKYMYIIYSLKYNAYISLQLRLHVQIIALKYFPSKTHVHDKSFQVETLLIKLHLT